MKYTEALERINHDRSLVFNAEDEISSLQLWGDGDGFYVFSLQGLFDAGNPWIVFELDWKEQVE